jgi:phosphoribosyl 1,2-cyclic phosphodiesterase
MTITSAAPARFARKHEIPIWMTAGTYRGLEKLFETDIDLHLIQGYAPFLVNDISIEPYPVPHDAREPAQFVFSDGARRLGVLTDVGQATAHIQRCLSGCDALVMECNHDPALLAYSDYPETPEAAHLGPLRASGQRTSGRSGRGIGLHPSAARPGRTPQREQQSPRACA